MCKKKLYGYERGRLKYDGLHSNWCSKGDYNDLYDLCKEDVEPIVPKVKHFIDKVASLIEI